MSSTPVVALVDCNNFFVSCERLFRPDLQRRPVVVLSSNDGCVVSRSDEAKVLGIAMGEPYFAVRERLGSRDIEVFSSNFPLYGDISRRVMSTLARFSETVEVYSVDEAFLTLSDTASFEHWAIDVRSALLQEVGVPVSVGVAATKTLAKVATHCAKVADRSFALGNAYGVGSDAVHSRGVRILTDPGTAEAALGVTPVEDVWGVGSRLALALRTAGIRNALELARADDAWVRARLTVCGLRTVHELRGRMCFPVGGSTSIRKSLLHSRSFGAPVYDRAALACAVTYHARKVAETLRAERVVAGTVRIFLVGARGMKRMTWQAQETFTVPTDDTLTLVHAACGMLDRLYRPHVRYRKAGVLVERIVEGKGVPMHTVFGEDTRPHAALMRELDALRYRFGDVVRVAAECGPVSWETRHAALSPRYTTAWNEIAQVRIV